MSILRSEEFAVWTIKISTALYCRKCRVKWVWLIKMFWSRMFSLGFLLEFDVGFKWKNLGTQAFYICVFYLKDWLVELDEFLECMKFYSFTQGKGYSVLSYRHLQAGKGLEEAMNSEALVIRQIFERFDFWAAELLREPLAAFVPLFLHLPSACSKYSLTSLGQIPFFASVCSALHNETPFLATLVIWKEA